MKSQRAKELIDSLPREVFPKRVGLPEAIRAVEIAEEEAEERMREKAMKAYCYAYGCRHYETCSIGPEKCPAAARFNQKLNEE